MVKVYRLITCNTYEREMFDKASLKLGLDKAVLQSTTALKDTSVLPAFFFCSKGMGMWWGVVSACERDEGIFHAR